MATQLSAITMIGTTGQGYTDGMRFIQFYFGLPLAMIILSLTLVPFFYRSGVYTAYEYLERRFDAKTRTFTSLLFLISRGMSCGAVVSAPAVVLSLILGWDLTLTALVITRAGGDLHDVRRRPGGDLDRREDHGPDRLRPVRGRSSPRSSGIPTVSASPADCGSPRPPAGCARSISRSTSPNQYTFWSGTIAALFLFCSYFGTDQSQVQRYLTARSVDEARHSLLMSAYWKIPLQALVLLLGVFVFVFYIFNPPPLLFSSVQQERLREGPRAAEYAALQAEFDGAFDARRRRRASWRGASSGRRRRATVAAEERVPRARSVDAAAARPGRGAGAARPPATARSPTSTTSFRRSS